MEGVGSATFVILLFEYLLQDEVDQMHECNPLCVLDFYVHESCRRQGHGLELFRHATQLEAVRPEQLAYEMPSHKFISFLARHCNLRVHRPQVKLTQGTWWLRFSSVSRWSFSAFLFLFSDKQICRFQRFLCRQSNCGTALCGQVVLSSPSFAEAFRRPTSVYGQHECGRETGGSEICARRNRASG